MDVLNYFGNVPLICCLGSAMNKILTQGQTESSATTLLAVTGLLLVDFGHTLNRYWLSKQAIFQKQVESTTFNASV